MLKHTMMGLRRMRSICSAASGITFFGFLATSLLVGPMMLRACAQGGTELTHFHLSPRPTPAQPISASAMLDRLDGLCRFTAHWQDPTGAIVDPYLHRDFQYATPYFAFAVGTLVEAGRSRELLPHGIAAMESATRQLGGGDSAVPDGHGEFFLASLSEALPV